MTTTEERRKLLADVTPIGQLLRLTGCVRVYKEGFHLGAVFRWWHPLAWVVWLVALQWCGWVGEPVNEVVPFRLSPYWSEHKDEIEWL